ncbi:MAG: hypothetical protein EZS28_036588 [Streblomastix strix]|uniref:Uncharacterized protein n=1 Tax=Streblomastix strix TaxID=222440 RepID=A0A5J4UBI4_9EUKA|nr:MAG: hypothetical protein EZS28_036588 [Streblomastix strix]
MVSTRGARRVLSHIRLFWFSFKEFVKICTLLSAYPAGGGSECLDFQSIKSDLSWSHAVFPGLIIPVQYLLEITQLTYLVSVPVKTSNEDKLIINEVILALTVTSQQVEGQVVVASKLKVTITNILQVKVVRLVIVIQFIDVFRPTVSPTVALVSEIATGSVVIISTVIILVLELQG